MAKEKACKQCRTIYEGPKCPKCGSAEFTESFKGKIHVFNSEQSELANNLKIKDKGEFAVRLR